MDDHEEKQEARKRLGFASAIEEYIAPLLATRGFIRTEESPNFFRFDSPKVLLFISHDPLSYEINVVFSRKVDPLQVSTLRNMLDVLLGSSHEVQDFFQASDRDRVIACVKEIARILQDFGQSVLAGEPAIYEQMSCANRWRNEAYTKEVVQTPIREAALDAWKRHDYLKVRELYESIVSDLTPIEELRLKYVQRINE